MQEVLERMMHSPAELGRRAEWLTAAWQRVDGRLPIPSGNYVIVVLSGSLNPVHRSHIQLLHETVKALTLSGRPVLAALLAPSSHSYVKGKLGDEAIPLPLRNDMCRDAIREDGAEYLGVAPWGMASGSDICRRLDAVEIPKLISRDAMAAAQVTVTSLAVYGSDFLVRCPGCLRKPTLIFARQDSDQTAVEASRLIDVARANGVLHHDFVYIAPSHDGSDAGARPSVIPERSSSEIRRVSNRLIGVDDGDGSPTLLDREEALRGLRELMQESVLQRYFDFLQKSAAEAAARSSKRRAHQSVAPPATLDLPARRGQAPVVALP